jgi:hypothetical protein
MEANPGRIYINMSSSSADTVVTTSTDPEAHFYEIRKTPILADVSKYRMCIVRAALLGNRNFPLLQASIQTGQPLPFLTTYTVSLQVVAGEGEVTGVAQPVLPFPYGAGEGFRACVLIKTYDALNTLHTAKVRSVLSAVPISIAGVAAALQAAINVSADPLMQIMTVTAAGNYLQFGAIDPAIVPPSTTSTTAGWWYSVEPWRQGGDGFDMYSYGFGSGAPVESDTTGTRLIVLPYPCSYSLPIVESIPTNGGVFTGTATMTWEPQVSGLYPPLPPIDTVDSSSEAYWLYDYAWFSYLLNKTLRSAFNQITDAAILAGVSLSLECPSVIYVPSRNAFSIRTSYGTTPTTATGGDQISITLNKSLSNLMAWPGKFLRDGTSTLLWDSAVRTADGVYLDLIPDYAATGSGWSPIGSLVFLCSRWMIRSEVMSAPNKVGMNVSSNSNPSNSTLQILSDVIPAFSDASDWNAYPILYSPQVLRWIDMPAGSFPLSEIDFTCAWRNAVTGVIRPVTLNPGSSFSVKILLQRKDLDG